ncbi:MAG: 3-deoxy-manno-octulosonate cytidylyltransferase [Candidatus Melainabacteria bacterium]|nr:3-deoxy-manno-octulosonate cytidylyltransferase [Candidatus Melainabacteria bacterium]MBI3309402.1 3-deoxy-manno-octulosonate cytidylyltransferase [Candidatus Melainabacteria bacterium]
MSIVVIIPARYDSVRFPGKPLALISGKPMIEHVVSAAQKSKLANQVIVATDDERICDFVTNKLSSKAVLTSKKHNSGTDRISEVVKKDPSIKLIVNLQGDEPLIPSSYIDKVLEPLLTPGTISMTSLITQITNNDDLNNPNIVKVVMDSNGFALYFSRSAIPYNRTGKKDIKYFKHIGIYGYTREAILQFNLLPQSSLEQSECLEQLRAMENGIKIKLEVVPKAFPAVDIPDDINIVENIIKLQAVKS